MNEWVVVLVVLLILLAVSLGGYLIYLIVKPSSIPSTQTPVTVTTGQDAGQDAVTQVSATQAPLPIGSRVSLKSLYNGKFLSRCHGCITGATQTEVAGVHELTDNGGHSIFTVVGAGDGKVALKGDNGKYLGRCSGCVSSKTIQIAALHVDTVQPWSTWTVEPIEAGVIALKSDDGNYLAICEGCTPGLNEAGTVHAPTSSGSPARWRVSIK